MPDPQPLGRARIHAHMANMWATQQDDLPTVLLRLLAEDVPWLLATAHDAIHEQATTALLAPDVADELAAHQWLANTVNLVRLETAAIDHGTPELYNARKWDVQDALDDPCPEHIRLALEVAVRELAETTWTAEATADTNGSGPC